MAKPTPIIEGSPDPEKPPARTAESYERELEALRSSVAKLEADLKEAHRAVKRQKAEVLRVQGFSLGRYAEYDAQLAILRKEASKQMLQDADTIDPPEGAKAKPG